jgi:hypothetical protein
MPNPFNLVSDVLSNAVGNTTNAITSTVSDSVVNGTKASITGIPKCTYQSNFISAVDNKKYGIVTSSLDGLNTIGCTCQNEDNSSTNEKAKKVSSYEINPFPRLSSDIYVCQISPNININ